MEHYRNPLFFFLQRWTNVSWHLIHLFNLAWTPCHNCSVDLQPRDLRWPVPALLPVHFPHQPVGFFSCSCILSCKTNPRKLFISAFILLFGCVLVLACSTWSLPALTANLFICVLDVSRGLSCSQMSLKINLLHLISFYTSSAMFVMSEIAQTRIAGLINVPFISPTDSQISFQFETRYRDRVWLTCPLGLSTCISASGADMTPGT